MRSSNSESVVNYKRLGFMGYPKYRVGDDGSVWSFRCGVWKRLKPCPNKSRRGYMIVSLCAAGKVKTHYVHTLVLEAFVGPKPKPNMEARHYPDPDVTNNRLRNLSWTSEKVNQRDRDEHGTHNKGTNNSSAKITDSMVRKMRRVYKSGGYTYEQLGALFGLSKAQSNKIVNRKSWVHVI